jgi:hypothetical protein
MHIIISPLHIYDFDPQGQLAYNDKREMYELAIQEQAKVVDVEKIIVIGHGINTNFKFIGNPKVHYIHSTYYQEPNEDGLFSKNQAQHLVVKEGLQYCIKTYGPYRRIIKSRADSVIFNPNAFCNPGLSFTFTQQTTFSEPYELGDCFMEGSAKDLLDLWSVEDNEKTNGLEVLADAFIKKFCANDRSKFLDGITKCNFIDLTDAIICDLRFNYKKIQSSINQVHNNPWEYVWGYSNGWLSVDASKSIDKSDRANMLTKKVYEKIRNHKPYQKLIIAIVYFNRLLWRYIRNESLYKM